MDRMIIVSSDSHITPPPAAIEEYLEDAYKPWMAQYHEENNAWLEMLEFLKFPPEILDIIDKEHRIRTGGDLGWDVDRRIEEMDAEGVAGELLIASTHAAATPFFGYANRVYPAEVRIAGIRAYHRWTADFMAAADGRLFGVALPGPCLDMDQALTELRWCADHGFRSVAAPGSVKEQGLPPLYDRYFDPYWDTCQDRGIVLSVHASHGRAQGTFMPFVERSKKDLGHDATPHRVQNALHSGELMESPFTPDLNPQQVLWELMVGGVFDRFPNLMIAFTEVRADWVPETMRALDERFERGETPLTRRPSEYWHSNCMAGASSIKQSEIRLRQSIGIDRIMFGRDYPHAEGTWPNTYDWLRDALRGVPENEARMLLGENAIRCYGLDRDRFAAVAERIGPRPEDILGDHHTVPPELVANFAKRAGYAKTREHVDLPALLERCRMPEDLAG